MGPGRAMLSAVAMYTWLPVRKHDWKEEDFPASLLAFPWLGAMLGAAAGALGWGISWLSGSVFLGAGVSLAVVAWVTGAMHLDGLADVADGLGSRKPAEQARAIMKQSDIGPMGVASLVLVLVVELGAVTAAPEFTWPLLLATGMAAGRVTTLAAALPRPGEQAQPGSLSALVSGKIGKGQLWPTRVAVAAAVAATSWGLLGWRAAVAYVGAVLAAWVLAQLWQRHLIRRFGRLNGDCYGSLIEGTQMLVWLLLASSAKLIGAL